MNRKLLLSVLGVVGFAGSAMAAPPSLTFTRSTVSGGLTAFDFSILNNGNDTAMASYAISLGFEGVSGATFNQLRTTGTAAPTSPAQAIKVYSVAFGANEEGNALPLTNDTYVYDALPGTYRPATFDFGTNVFSSEISGVNPFGAGSIAGTVFVSGNTATRYAISYGTPSLNPGGDPPSLGFNNNVPVAHLVLSTGTNVTWTGIIARQGANFSQTGTTVPSGNPVGVTVTAGGTATTTISGNNVSYIPTVVQTYATPVATGSTTFAFAGTNTGVSLIALDLNLGTTSLATALGTLPSNVTIYTGTNAPFSSAYDVVLLANTSGSGPFTFAFTLGGTATANAIAVVPEPTGLAGLTVAALPALARRRRA